MGTPLCPAAFPLSAQTGPRVELHFPQEALGPPASLDPQLCPISLGFMLPTPLETPTPQRSHLARTVPFELEAAGLPLGVVAT